MSKLILTLDASALTAFKSCEYFFDLNNIENLVQIDRTTKEEVKKKGLTMGTAWHKLMKRYYELKQQKKVPNEIVREVMGVLQGLSEEFIPFQTKNGIITPEMQLDLLRYKIVEYAGKYQKDNWNIIAIEKGFSYRLYEDNTVLFISEGMIDLVMEQQGVVLFTDHKTQAFEYELNPASDQFYNYAIALNSNVGFINYCGLQKTKDPNDAFRRVPINFRPDQLRMWKEETIDWYFRILRAKITGKFMRNRSYCYNKFGICPYFKLCQQSNPETVKEMKRNEFTIGEGWQAW